MSIPFSNTNLRVPRGFGNILEGLAREVLRNQPQDIPTFAALYFNGLLKDREDSGQDPAEWGAKLEDRFYNNHAFKQEKEKDAESSPTSEQSVGRVHENSSAETLGCSESEFIQPAHISAVSTANPGVFDEVPGVESWGSGGAGGEGSEDIDSAELDPSHPDPYGGIATADTLGCSESELIQPAHISTVSTANPGVFDEVPGVESWGGGGTGGEGSEDIGSAELDPSHPDPYGGIATAETLGCSESEFIQPVHISTVSTANPGVFDEVPGVDSWGGGGTGGEDICSAKLDPSCPDPYGSVANVDVCAEGSRVPVGGGASVEPWSEGEMDLGAALGSPAPQGEWSELPVPRAMEEIPAGQSVGSPQLDFGDYEVGQTQDAGANSTSEKTLQKVDIAEHTQGEADKRVEMVAEDGEGKEEKMIDLDVGPVQPSASPSEQHLGDGNKSGTEPQTRGQEVLHIDSDVKDKEEVPLLGTGLDSAGEEDPPLGTALGSGEESSTEEANDPESIQPQQPCTGEATEKTAIATAEGINEDTSPQDSARMKRTLDDDNENEEDDDKNDEHDREEMKKDNEVTDTESEKIIVDVQAMEDVSSTAKEQGIEESKEQKQYMELEKQEQGTEEQEQAMESEKQEQGTEDQERDMESEKQKKGTEEQGQAMESEKQEQGTEDQERDMESEKQKKGTEEQGQAMESEKQKQGIENQEQATESKKQEQDAEEQDHDMEPERQEQGTEDQECDMESERQEQDAKEQEHDMESEKQEQGTEEQEQAMESEKQEQDAEDQEHDMESEKQEQDAEVQEQCMESEEQRGVLSPKMDMDKREPKDETEAPLQNPDERNDSLEREVAQQEEAKEVVPVEGQGQHEEECSQPQEEEDVMDIPLDDPEANKAAAKIQAGFRGHMTRKKMKDDKPQEVSSSGDTLNGSQRDSEPARSEGLEGDDTSAPEQ